MWSTNILCELFFPWILVFAIIILNYYSTLSIFIVCSNSWSRVWNWRLQMWMFTRLWISIWRSNHILRWTAYGSRIYKYCKRSSYEVNIHFIFELITCLFSSLLKMCMGPEKSSVPLNRLKIFLSSGCIFKKIYALN